MTREGLKAARAHAGSLTRYKDRPAAENHLYAWRDKLLSSLQGLAASRPELRLDYSPESLRRLEPWCLTALDDYAVSSAGMTRDDLGHALSLYLGAVFVANVPAFEWLVEEYAFEKGKYEIGVGTPQFKLMLTNGHNLEAQPNNKNKDSLWTLFQRFSTVK